ncbi:Transcription termination/antitermination protein NusG [Buchnera aphidicola (Cinara kochiana kochiana)]|uniref:Transcription termination/antitermination protein NusG n=1 Tax=Buchnera aphidicola (Cinara kochiana kochiana) TaxID=2518976 RepID=A0A451D529_9GAMM|nr:transcription termination/antitermination protein NusG [Buchnera aphidicola]VFP80951.1 Transcription termination/antitermination protein NusG [Buchnera aphidicola (Cinara kochiana kochiana)]
MCIDKKKWYVLQAFSGFENKVAQSILNNKTIKKMQDIFGQVIVPSEEVIEIRKGQRKKSDSKFFPGYILIEMIMNNDSWHLIKNLPKVLGFVGGTAEKPTPISTREINIILKKLKKIGNKPRPKKIFEPGENIRVNDGPFSDFNGIVETVDYEKNRLKVSVSIFGRSTPVELSFNQVEKY